MYRIDSKKKAVALVDPASGKIVHTEYFSTMKTAMLFHQLQLERQKILEAQIEFVASCKQDQHMSDEEIRSRFFR